LSDTATRNETITFTVSLEDLVNEMGRGPHSCIFPQYADLRSELGLTQWVQASLSPVDQYYLTVGYHKPPKTTGGPTSGQSVVGGAGGSPVGQGTQKPVPGAGCTGTRTPMGEPPQLDRASVKADINLVWCDFIIIFGYNDMTKLTADQARQVATTITDAQRAIRDLVLLNEKPDVRRLFEEKAIALATFVDPPIDTLAHQVQFLIVEGASASPSWTLVNFKGPGPATGSLFSVTKTKTHTLNIVMGIPGSSDTQGALAALQTGTAVGNALSQSPLTLTR
jgi:hypothetical protein